MGGLEMSSRAVLRRRVLLSVTVVRHDRQDRQVAHTLDLTEFSARLGGLARSLTPGEIVEIHRGTQKARFQVAWMGAPGTTVAGQAGVRCMESSQSICGVDLQCDESDSPEPKSESIVVVTDLAGIHGVN